jgi:hypothetical protein
LEAERVALPVKVAVVPPVNVAAVNASVLSAKAGNVVKPKTGDEHISSITTIVNR